MSDTHWIAQDVVGSASSNTLALREGLMNQRHLFNEAKLEERKLRMFFWMGKILADAVQVPELPKSHRLAILQCDLEFLEEMCIALRAKKPSIPCCVIHASEMNGILLGCSEPPRALGEWVMRYVEGLDPACVP